MKRDFWRQMDFYNPSKDNNSVLIVGCGQIGSYIAFGLTEMGVRNLTIVDHDTVAPHNPPNQFFAQSLLKSEELFKVLVAKSTIHFMVEDENIKVYTSKVEGLPSNESYDVIFSCVDDMNVRKYIFNRFRDTAKHLIDVRTAGEFFNVFNINLRDEDASEYYRRSLYSNEEASPLPCTGTAVIDVSFSAAGEAIQRYRKFVKGYYNTMETFHDNAFTNGGVIKLYPGKYNNRDISPTTEFIQGIGQQEVTDEDSN